MNMNLNLKNIFLFVNTIYFAYSKGAESKNEPVETSLSEYSEGPNMADFVKCNDIQSVKNVLFNYNNLMEKKNELLVLAASRGFLGMVEILIKDYSADVNYNNDKAIKEATIFGYFDLVRFLIEKYGANSEYVLKLAKRYNHHDIVNYMTENEVKR